MRAGAYTIHQSLTAEAAAVLKLALGLARRRGHAQVTPLHVAFALLTGPAAAVAAPPPPMGAFSSSSTSSAAAAYGLLKRACLRSHPAPSHPLQCRALELCFNVALNRLPTSAPCSPPPGGPSSFASSLIQPSPTLSNALVAALKRAQANQRRGCVELHQPLPAATPSSAAAAAQQQQPLLAIKVELDQLVISILDDPSVSRVMREAGFSSAVVKSNLEEESALMPPPSSSSSSPPPPPQVTVTPPNLFHDSSSIAIGGGGFGMWQAQFLAAPSPVPSCKADDLNAVLEVMVRKQGKRSNPVVVGDSVSMAEAVAGELLRRLERGDVPEELAGAHLLKLQLSYVHVRLMSRADVDARAAELRRGVDAVPLQRGGGLVVYVGDLRWALDEDNSHTHTASSYSPVEHMVAELGRLLDDLRASRGRAWLVATASYQTYMRWQQRRRRQENVWALQAVLVPTGGGTGLSLNNLHPSGSAAPMQPTMVAMHQPGRCSLTMAPHPTAFAERDGHQAEKLVLCVECSKNYEREASMVKAEADAQDLRARLPAWLVPDRPPPPPPADQTQHNKDTYLMELKRKWSRLCRKLHLCSDPPCPWWAGPCMPPSRPRVATLLGLEGLMTHGKSSRSAWSPPSAAPPVRWELREPGCQDVVGTELALGNLPLADTASSDGRHAPGSDDGSARELERRLRRNIPWQPGAVAAEIAKAVASGHSDEEKRTGAWLYVKGSDHAAVRRAATVIVEITDRVVVCADDLSKFRCAEEFCADVVARARDAGGTGRKRLVLVFGDVECAPEDVVDCLVAASRSGALKDRSSGREVDLADSVVILATSKLTSGGRDDVIDLRLWSEDEETAPGGDLKRKQDAPPSPTTERKRSRHDDVSGGCLDLNIDLCASDVDDEEDEAIPSDITHEGSGDDDSDHPRNLLESVAARAVVVTLDNKTNILDHLHARLARALAGEHQPPLAAARVHDDAVELLVASSGHFLDETLERWIAEVLQPAAATVRNSGKGNVLVLGMGRGSGGAAHLGFMGSALPSRIHVD